MAELIEYVRPAVSVSVVIEDEKGFQSRQQYYVNASALQSWEEGGLGEFLQELAKRLDACIAGKIVSISYTAEVKLTFESGTPLKTVALAHSDVEETLQAQLDAFSGFKGGVHTIPTFDHDSIFVGTSQIPLSDSNAELNAYFDVLLGNPGMTTLVAALTDNRGNEAPYNPNLLLKKKFRKRD